MYTSSFAVLYSLSMIKHRGSHLRRQGMNNAGSTICFDYRRLDIYYEIRDSKRVQTVGGRLRYRTERYRNSPIESSSHNTRSKRQRLRVEVAKWTTCSRLLSLSPIRIIRSPATYVSNYPRAGLCLLALGFVASKFRGLAMSRSTYHSSCHTLAQARLAVNFPKRPTQLSSLVI